MAGSSPTPGLAAGSPVGREFPNHCQSSDDEGVSTDTSISDKPPAGGMGAEEVEVAGVVVTPMELAPLGGRHKKKDGFSSKIQIPKFRGKKGHPHDVADTFRQWARCITYYRDYYEDSYLMPLVVSSLMGDASDVFDWILSLNPGNTQDLTTLLQMLREHYCGSLTFREQRNTIENLHQRPQEAAIDFLIRVGTSVSNLGKDWKDKLTDKELQSLQYEVSLNGVQEEIRHVLDSEIAKNGGKLTPQQMHEAVKRYETYVARNKGTSSSASQQKAAGHTSGYKPRFHKATAFAATIAESEDDGPCCHESSSQEGADPFGAEYSQEDDKGLFIPSYLEEALPDDPVLQGMACAMWAQEVETRRCFTCNQQGHLQRDHWKYEEKKQDWTPAAKGASPKQVGSREGEVKTPSIRSKHVPSKSSKIKRAPYLSPDAFYRFIGPKNLGKALIDDELTTCLLDNGAQLNFITPAYAQERGMDIMSLDYLAQEIGGSVLLFRGLGSISMEPVGFVMMYVKVPCVQGYNEDQIAIVMDDPGMMEWPVILGTPTLYRVMEVIKESEISELAVPWASSRVSLLMRDIQAKLGQVVMNDVANKPILPLNVDEVVRVTSKCTIPPFGHKAIHGKVNLILHGYKMNVMTHGLKKQSPALPLGIDVQTVYATLADGSNRVTMLLRNNTRDWLEIKKGMPITRMVAANEVPKVTNLLSAEEPKEQPTLTEVERQDLLLEKLDLMGLEAWPEDQAGKAHSLLKEYHDIFSLEKRDIGHTNATKHKIVLKDPDTPPFKEHFCRIPPPQLDEVREHLKLMMDTGVIRPSNSPWCNAVVLVRKKDGSLRFCINFRKLNSLTVKDSHPLPHICETLESLVGDAHYSTFDMNSGFWQVPMDEESKQYTAFTLGSMGLYECESMPFGLCNALPTFQRLMQNCLGELNLTYCLIYLDDMIVFSEMPEEHLWRMRVVFDPL